MTEQNQHPRAKSLYLSDPHLPLRLAVDAGNVFSRIGKTPSELAEELERKDALLREMAAVLRCAAGACNSTLTIPSRSVVIDGCQMYAQTQEWCEWVQDEILETIKDCICKYEQQTQEQS